MTVQTAGHDAPKAGFSLYDPRLRGIVYQVLLLAALVALVWTASSYAVANMARLGIPLNFDFWNQTAGFEINQTLVSYSALSTYGQAFWVGLYNTLLVGAFGIVFATIIGFVVAVLRLSPNWIVSKLATVYVELFRNIPLLLQLVFWYTVVLKSLPQPRQSVSVFGAVFLNTRGLVVPNAVFHDNAAVVGWALVAGVVLTIAFSVYGRRRQAATGQQSPVLWVSLGLLLGLPVLAYLLAGMPIGLEMPVLRGFNFSGGRQIFPELAALLLGLSIYTGAFISEIVRAGIMAVGRGQHEAASALGIRSNVTMRRVVIPQAMRVIVPPLTNQYLNLVKNSSLAVFIGYPDLVQVFAGTVLNQTGAAIQCMALTGFVYLAISLVLSTVMNVYNKRVALVER
ncbi:amino acid ABC transporter permease [Lichenibacterium ramalinae]|uniref:Amino acid ABC transporter permease n=1 Tax=Lichenibacterium ramalinae TaxID=2316527 RepID=A0A4Q2R965_9HYPH|nr:amino acid ABC transporter permease [Lichenibacterium ramalinae]RYB02054.1 amino acid ABC transporter permease [Lichenibacterium ramalinae]